MSIEDIQTTPGIERRAIFEGHVDARPSPDRCTCSLHPDQECAVHCTQCASCGAWVIEDDAEVCRNCAARDLPEWALQIDPEPTAWRLDDGDWVRDGEHCDGTPTITVEDHYAFVVRVELGTFTVELCDVTEHDVVAVAGALVACCGHIDTEIARRIADQVAHG